MFKTANLKCLPPLSLIQPPLSNIVHIKVVCSWQDCRAVGRKHVVCGLHRYRLITSIGWTGRPDVDIYPAVTADRSSACVARSSASFAKTSFSDRRLFILFDWGFLQIVWLFCVAGQVFAVKRCSTR